jgi:hypothetical protein
MSKSLSSSPRFNRLYRALKHADRRIERANKFLRKTQTAKARSIENTKSVPENATIREEYVKCGNHFVFGNMVHTTMHTGETVAAKS